MAANALHGSSVVHNGVQTGTCLNRWFDKSLQLIVCSNGMAGINFEHSLIDGHTVLRFASDIFTDTILRFAEAIRLGFVARSGGVQRDTPVVCTPHKVLWRLTPVRRGAGCG